VGIKNPETFSHQIFVSTIQKTRENLVTFVHEGTKERSKKDKTVSYALKTKNRKLKFFGGNKF
jgi:hypothetical protein